MKIAIVGAIDNPITKNSHAGTEIWTYNFAEGLVRKGHDVTLYASKGSQFSGKLKEVVEEDAIKGADSLVSKPKFALFSIKEMVEVVKEQENFDLIHISVYSLHYALPLVELLHIPVVVTIHGTAFVDSDMEEVFSNYQSPYFVFISQHFAKKWPHPNRFKVIYNGIDIEKFEFNPEPKSYYFHMGRITSEKGVDDVIAFARKSGEELILAGTIKDKAYFDQKIKPYLSEKIKYVGELDFEEKIKYYKNAKAFLLPIKWEEPFGLVVVEAMACGTPVIAYNRGAMSELIEDGKNGFLVPKDDIDGLLKAAKKISTIKRENCRQSANRFKLDTMIDNYLEYYKEIIEND